MPAQLADVVADALVDVAHVVLVGELVGEGLAARVADDLVALADVPLGDVRLQVRHHLLAQRTDGRLVPRLRLDQRLGELYRDLLGHQLKLYEDLIIQDSSSKCCCSSVPPQDESDSLSNGKGCQDQDMYEVIVTSLIVIIVRVRIVGVVRSRDLLRPFLFLDSRGLRGLGERRDGRGGPLCLLVHLKFPGNLRQKPGKIFV